MSSTTFTVRVETDVKKRLEKLAKSTGRSRSFLAAGGILVDLLARFSFAGLSQPNTGATAVLVDELDACSLCARLPP